ncbi:MAG: DUF2147 domain-containing protein [Pseudomonadota bacterium]
MTAETMARRRAGGRLVRVSALVLALAAMLGGGGLAMASDAPHAAAPAVGLWKTAVDEGRFLHVRIAPCATGQPTLCGTIEGAFGGADTAIVGRPIIWDMRPNGPGAWEDGRVWAADEDETYRAKMAMKSADVLELSGCILGGLICRGQDWTRLP